MAGPHPFGTTHVSQTLRLHTRLFSVSLPLSIFFQACLRSFNGPLNSFHLCRHVRRLLKNRFAGLEHVIKLLVGNNVSRVIFEAILIEVSFHEEVLDRVFLWRVEVFFRRGVFLGV